MEIAVGMAILRKGRKSTNTKIIKRKIGPERTCLLRTSYFKKLLVYVRRVMESPLDQSVHRVNGIRYHTHAKLHSDHSPAQLPSADTHTNNDYFGFFFVYSLPYRLFIL